LLDSIEIDLRGTNDQILTVYIDIADNSLSRKWLAAVNDIVRTGLHLEKNYCWLGWTESARNAEYLCTQINRSIMAINASALDYRIADFFSPSTVIQRDLDINHARMNQLHRYFEDLQGTAGAMSAHYTAADDVTRWHIRQLNLLFMISLVSILLIVAWAVCMWVLIKQWANIIGKCSVTKAEIRELANWLLQDYAHRLKPLRTLILNGHVIPANTIGKLQNWQSFVNGLPGTDSTLLTPVSQLGTRRWGKWILPGRLAQPTTKQSGHN